MTVFQEKHISARHLRKSNNYIPILVVITSGICVMIFGACARDPRQYRLPMPQYNYLGAGFGMMILCCLFAGFCFAFVIGDINTSRREEEENEKYRR